MKHKLFTLLFLFSFSVSFSFAAEVEDNAVKNDPISLSEQNHQTVNDLSKEIVMPITPTKKHKKHAFKKFFKKSGKTLKEKFYTFAPMRILVLMIIGFLLMLPGMILTQLFEVLIWGFLSVP